MSDLRKNLKSEFEDEDYRYSYAESFLNSKIAAQIKTLREQRVKTQAELAELIGTKQSGFSRFEDVNHSVWKTDTLWKIARGLGVRLDVSFKTFGSLIHDKENFKKQALECPTFEDDPVFQDEPKEVPGYLENVFMGIPPKYADYSNQRGMQPPSYGYVPYSYLTKNVATEGWSLESYPLPPRYYPFQGEPPSSLVDQFGRPVHQEPSTQPEIDGLPVSASNVRSIDSHQSFNKVSFTIGKSTTSTLSGIRRAK